MTLLCIFIGLFLIGGYKLYKSCQKTNYAPDFKSCIFGYFFISGSVGLLLYVLASMLLTFVITTSWVKDIDCTLISLTTNSNVEGGFVLGTGIIQNVKYYYYRVQYEDGGIREYSVPVHLSTIYETDNIPKIERYILELPKNITYMQNPFGVQAYKFYVPKGTVIKEFVIR